MGSRNSKLRKAKSFENLNVESVNSNVGSRPDLLASEAEESLIEPEQVELLGPDPFADTEFVEIGEMAGMKSEGISVLAEPFVSVAVPSSGHPEVAELRQQIEGKNELIAALVGELEQVAEQLERAKRSGVDRPRGNSSSAALPPEVVEEHQQVLGELQRVVEQWEQLQAASTLGRIESQLMELRSLVAGNGGRPVSASNQPEESHSNSNSLDSIIAKLAAEAESESDHGKQVESNPPVRSWESLKQEMLHEPAPNKPADDHSDELVGLLNGLSSPAPIDMETATLDELKKACVERDTYIVQITRWVRTRRTVSLPVDWDTLQSVPDEMRRQVNLLASRLEEQVRLAEVEMSLERARLSREKSQFQSEVAIMEKHLKRLGITSLDELEDIAVNSSSSTDRRWMRFLGVNRKG